MGLVSGDLYYSFTASELSEFEAALEEYNAENPDTPISAPAMTRSLNGLWYVTGSMSDEQWELVDEYALYGPYIWSTQGHSGR